MNNRWVDCRNLWFQVALVVCWGLSLPLGVLRASEAPRAVTHEQEGAPKGAPQVVVEALMEAFNAHDIAAMSELCSPNIRWASVSAEGLSFEAEDLQALKDGMTGYFKGLPSVRSLHREIFVSGPFVSTLEEVSWQSEGETRSQCSVGVYQVMDGKIVTVWYFDSHRCDETPIPAT